MFEVEINAGEAQAALSRLEAATGDLSVLMRDIGDYLVVATKDRFAAGTDPGGTPWAPKSQTTLDAYAARGDRSDPRPLHGPSGTLALTIFADAGRTRVRVGSPTVYAAMMQFGGTRSQFAHLWGDIPARPFLGLSADDEEAITAEVIEWMGRAAGGRP